MKVLAVHCPILGYAVTTPSKAAVDLDTDLIGAWRFVPRCLLLQIGIETDDATRIAAAVEVIRRTARYTRPRTLVINGLSSLAAPAARSAPPAARAILTDLVVRLTSRPEDLPVLQLPFGWNKQFRLSVAAGDREQRLIHL